MKSGAIKGAKIINDINAYAIADATIGRTLYGNTANADSQFAGTNFVGKNMEFYQGSWQNIYTIRPSVGTGTGQPSGPFIQSGESIYGLQGSVNDIEVTKSIKGSALLEDDSMFQTKLTQ